MIPELKTFLVAMSPIVELRGSIPLALIVYGLPVWSAYFFSVLGNLVPLVVIGSLLGPVSQFLSRKISFFKNLFEFIFSRTRKRHIEKFRKWEDFALILLVAIPLPFTGVWTGTIAAFVFGVPFKRSFPLITFGCLIAGFIVTFLTLGAGYFF
jgi:uncharacterized membrane protein